MIFDATKILHIDNDFAAKVNIAKAKLRPPLIGKDGTLQEWSEDWIQLEDHHRHLSPLYGLYPGNQFSFSKTPQLINSISKAIRLDNPSPRKKPKSRPRRPGGV